MLVVEVLIADVAEFRRATYSENEAMFPNHGMESHLVSQTKKYRTRAAKKNRHLTKKKERAQRRLRRTIAGRDAVMRSLIRAVYRFRDATLVTEKKDDFGSVL